MRPVPPKATKGSPRRHGEHEEWLRVLRAFVVQLFWPPTVTRPSRDCLPDSPLIQALMRACSAVPWIASAKRPRNDGPKILRRLRRFGWFTVQIEQVDLFLSASIRVHLRQNSCLRSRSTAMDGLTYVHSSAGVRLDEMARPRSGARSRSSSMPRSRAMITNAFSPAARPGIRRGASKVLPTA